MKFESKKLKDGLKACSRCKVFQPLENYYPRKNKKTGEPYPNGASMCKECSKKDFVKWLYDNKNYNIKRGKMSRLKVKITVFNHYGTKCACCNEATLEFLCVDHINGGGTKHRQELGNKGRGHNFYSWLIKNDFPEGFRILCHNCNFAFGVYGCCPHQGETMLFNERNSI